MYADVFGSFHSRDFANMDRMLASPLVGNNRAQQFQVAAWIQEEMRGQGTGRNKKEAEQVAAKSALDYFKIEPC